MRNQPKITHATVPAVYRKASSFADVDFACNVFFRRNNMITESHILIARTPHGAERLENRRRLLDAYITENP